MMSRPSLRSRPQECHYHAVIDEIAAAKGVERALAKRILVAQFRAETERDPEYAALWGQETRTRDMPRKLAAAFLDFLYSWQAQHAIKKSPDADKSRA